MDTKKATFFVAYMAYYKMDTEKSVSECRIIVLDTKSQTLNQNCEGHRPYSDPGHRQNDAIAAETNAAVPFPPASSMLSVNSPPALYMFPSSFRTGFVQV